MFYFLNRFWLVIMNSLVTQCHVISEVEQRKQELSNIYHVYLFLFGENPPGYVCTESQVHSFLSGENRTYLKRLYPQLWWLRSVQKNKKIVILKTTLSHVYDHYDRCIKELFEHREGVSCDRNDQWTFLAAVLEITWKADISMINSRGFSS